MQQTTYPTSIFTSDKGKFLLTWIRDDSLEKYSPVGQVYGIVFNAKGEILIARKKPEDGWGISGGTPETDESIEETLRRELKEEMDVSVSKITPLGVQKVELFGDNKGKSTLYQLRYIALLQELLPQTPDPDNGIIWERQFVPARDINEYVKWGDLGAAMFKDATDLMNQQVCQATKLNMQISILTFNICGVSIFSKNFFTKTQKIADIINKEDLDILNFQEVVFYNHLWYLKKLLPGFPYVVYKPSLLGPHAGLVTFSRLPLNIVKFQRFKKNGDFYNLSIIHMLAQRGMLISQLTNTDINIINTHFSSNMNNQWVTENHYTKVLKLQAKELGQLIQSDKEKFFLISGDFNIPKTSSLYHDLTQENLVDIFKDTDKATHLGDFFFDNINHLQVDYIFVSQNSRLQAIVVSRKFLFDQKIAFGSQKEYPSDHIGLEAHVNFRSL